MSNSIYRPSSQSVRLLADLGLAVIDGDREFHVTLTSTHTHRVHGPIHIDRISRSWLLDITGPDGPDRIKSHPTSDTGQYSEEEIVNAIIDVGCFKRDEYRLLNEEERQWRADLQQYAATCPPILEGRLYLRRREDGHGREYAEPRIEVKCPFCGTMHSHGFEPGASDWNVPLPKAPHCGNRPRRPGPLPREYYLKPSLTANHEVDPSTPYVDPSADGGSGLASTRQD